MQKKQAKYLVSFLVLTTLLMSSFSTSFVSAQGQSYKSAPGKIISGNVKASVEATFVGTVDMHKVPKESSEPAQNHSQMPFLTGMSQSQYERAKEAAAHNIHSPVIPRPFPVGKTGKYTPVAQKSFDGMANSASICPYFGGCQPPDMALATSTKWVFQGVNMSYAVYDTSGHIQSGWPKNAQNFFDVPNPPNNCDPRGPFLSDPRAFYDPNDGRFWAAILQVEGAFGIAPNCPFQSLYWFAVSQTNDPNGTWNVFKVDMTLGFKNAADYTQLGFDGQNIYFNGNMFNQAGSAYEYDELWGAHKGQFEHPNGHYTLYGFYKLMAPDGTLVDTVQPVESEAGTHSEPRDGLFVSSFNINSGGGSCMNGCNGIVLWAIQYAGTKQEQLEGVLVNTSTYTLPPNADQPSCKLCVETIDTRITATPVYHDGLISWALETAAQNKTQVVPSIYWGQILPQIVNAHLQGGILYQSGLFGFQGDQDASFGALMPDNNGNLIMVYDTMSSKLNPSIGYTGRRSTFPLGMFHDAGHFLRKGDAPTGDTRWGDYEATSYDGPAYDHIWFASQYSNSKGDWATFIAGLQFHY